MENKNCEITMHLGNIIQRRFLGLTEPQRFFWNRLKRLLDKKVELTVSDTAKLLDVPYSSAKGWVALLEDLGLISSRREGRDKHIQLRKDPPLTVDKKMLQRAFDEWCKDRGIS